MNEIGIGSKVVVVNYGHVIWQWEDGEMKRIDLVPEIVGETGIVTKVITTQGIRQFAVDGIPKKHAWYDEGQLKKLV